MAVYSKLSPLVMFKEEKNDCSHREKKHKLAAVYVQKWSNSIVVDVSTLFLWSDFSAFCYNHYYHHEFLV